MRDLFAKIRPQILLAILALSFIASYALRIDAVEVTTGCVSASAVLGKKIMEDKD